MAQQQTNGYRLDKSHSFVVNMFDDFDRYGKVPEEYAMPERKPYEPQVLLKVSATCSIKPLIRKLASCSRCRLPGAGALVNMSPKYSICLHT